MFLLEGLCRHTFLQMPPDTLQQQHELIDIVRDVLRILVRNGAEHDNPVPLEDWDGQKPPYGNMPGREPFLGGEGCIVIVHRDRLPSPHRVCPDTRPCDWEVEGRL
ncbi:MAG: hypothetical protein A4E37_01744 [Methanoregulaceae archaeon PtaB.Bin056]|nr:MAG: hypothetical protein A4E37_01744 [Methanoregulaceae archaeon PtaB.Bin056]